MNIRDAAENAACDVMQRLGILSSQAEDGISFDELITAWEVADIIEFYFKKEEE